MHNTPEELISLLRLYKNHKFSRNKQKSSGINNVETAYSSQVWNIKEGGPYVLVAEEKTATSALLMSCSWKKQLSNLPCPVTKKELVMWKSSSNTVTREITMFSLPKIELNINIVSDVF